MLTKEENKQIEAAAKSGTLLPGDLRSKYLKTIQAARRLHNLRVFCLNVATFQVMTAPLL